MMHRLVPITFGPIGRRGGGFGPLVDDSDALRALQRALDKLARASGVIPTPELMAAYTRQVLDLYAGVDNEWRKGPPGTRTEGHLYILKIGEEHFVLGSTQVLFGRGWDIEAVVARVLAREPPSTE